MTAPAKNSAKSANLFPSRNPGNPSWMRLSGHFVAVATLGFLVIVRVILFNADDFTRGSRTFSNVTPYTNLWWVWAWALFTLYIVWRLKYSSFGRAMFAQREDPLAAQSVGIAIMPPRLLAFVVSAFCTAVAGSLYAHFITSFSPTVFYFDLTFRVITMLIVGGMGSVSGSVIGTVLVIALAEALRRFEDVTLLYGLSQIILALIFIFIIIFRPEGLLGQREISLRDPELRHKRSRILHIVDVDLRRARHGLDGPGLVVHVVPSHRIVESANHVDAVRRQHVVAVVQVVLFRRKHRDGGARLLARVCRLLRGDSGSKQQNESDETIPHTVPPGSFENPQTLTTVVDASDRHQEHPDSECADCRADGLAETARRQSQ
jgi:hypothetical protein